MVYEATGKAEFLEPPFTRIGGRTKCWIEINRSKHEPAPEMRRLLFCTDTIYANGKIRRISGNLSRHFLNLSRRSKMNMPWQHQSMSPSLRELVFPNGWSLGSHVVASWLADVELIEFCEATRYRIRQSDSNYGDKRMRERLMSGLR
jgi:hypothetical protein